MEIDRRDVLKATGSAVGALTLGGLAGAGTPGTGRHIVGAASDATVDAATARADSVYRVIDLGPYGTAVAGTFPSAARSDLARRDDVKYVEKDKQLEVSGQVLPWGIDRVDADVAHANGKTGGDDSDGEGGADVAIIDTGIDDDHPDLHGNLATPLSDTSNHKAFESCKGRTATTRGPTTTTTGPTSRAPWTPSTTPRASSA